MIREGLIWSLCETLRAWRAGGQLDAVKAREGSRVLAKAIAKQVDQVQDYVPEEDRRVLWAREVLAAAMRGDRKPKASFDLEAMMDWFRQEDLVLSGKDRAAGGAA